MEGISGYPRPMSAAARAAALRAKMAGAGIKLPSSLHGIASSADPTYLTALEKLTTTTEKWLESIEKLKETAQKQQKRARPDDPASGDEREASRVLADDDSGKSVGSNERIRPSTPTNMPANMPRIVVEPSSSKSNSTLRELKVRPLGPVSPPERKLDSLEIKSPPTNAPDAMNIDSSAPSPSIPQIKTTSPLLPEPVSSSLFRPPVTAQTSIASIPPTLHTLVTPPLATPGETPSTKEPVLTAAPSDIVAPTPIPLSLPLPLRSKPSANSLKADTSVKSADALSTSSAKKRRLSAKTILESLMEKKSRNPIYYDGEIQKMFTDMVFEMSQQIQSMKREGRIVMFAKDPACRTLLVNLDNMLQKSLRTVEISSFLFLKGKPDVNQIEALKIDLQKSLKDVDDFKKSGWTMSSNEDDDDDDDDSSENEDEGYE